MYKENHMQIKGDDFFSGHSKNNEITWKQLVIVDIIVTYFNAISPERRMKEIGTDEPFEYTAGNNSHDCYYWINKWYTQVPRNLETRIKKIFNRKTPTRTERLRMREIRDTINKRPESEEAKVFKTYPKVPKKKNQPSKKNKAKKEVNNMQRKDVSQFEDGEFMDNKKFKKYVTSIPETKVSESANNHPSEELEVTERKINRIEDNVIRQAINSPVIKELDLGYVNAFLEDIRAKDIIAEFVAQDKKYKRYAIKVFYDKNFYETFATKWLNGNNSWKHKILDPEIAKKYPHTYEGMYTRAINDFEKVCVIVDIKGEYIQFLIKELVDRGGNKDVK